MQLVPSTLSYEKNSVIFFIVKMHSTTVSSQSKIHFNSNINKTLDHNLFGFRTLSKPCFHDALCYCYLKNVR